MCGIVGLFLKDKSLEPQLGAMLSDMLVSLSDRGPDSAGIAIYGAPARNEAKITVQSAKPERDFRGLDAELAKAIGAPVSIAVKSHPCRRQDVRRRQARRSARGASRRCVPTSASWAPARSSRSTRKSACPKRRRRALRPRARCRHAWHRPHPHGDGIGGDDAGRASVLDRRRPVPGAQRLAVQPQQPAPRADPRRHDASRPRTTPRSRPPISPGEMAQGKNLGEALEGSLDDLDGFFTFVVGTKNGFGVLRDPIACKPAVMAETDHYVAFGSEYRALADLPGIDNAQGLGAGARHRLFLGALSSCGNQLKRRRITPCRVFDLAVTSLRELNQALHGSTPGPTKRRWEVLNPQGSHAVAVGVDAPVTHRCARQRRLLLRRHERAGAPSPCTARPAPASPRT